MRLLEVSRNEGHWIVLEKIHLMPDWTPELQKKLGEYAQSPDTHDDFRVFLSAEPDASLPIGLLEQSIKLTNEPPQVRTVSAIRCVPIVRRQICSL